jgi:succinate-semialdehyde dehydrogenase/glutarate-semialdehyde dehydrogenase
MATTAAKRQKPATRVQPVSVEQVAAWSGLVFPGKKLQEHFSPLDGSLIAALPESTVADVDSAFRLARAAAESWKALSFAERKAVMMRFHNRVLEHQATLLDVVQWETGKSRSSAFDEVADIALTARYYANSAEGHLRPEKRQGALPFVTKTRVHFQPKGVVGMITPWNYPLTLPLSDAIPALMAGNGIVLKPDAQTPLSALSALHLLYQAGLPEGLFQVVIGDGAQLGSAIISHADFLMFTGSTDTGKIVAEQAARRLIGFSAELGGKNPMIVLDDAPLERALQGALSASFSNAGQLCMSIERLYVHTGIYDTFVPRLVAEVGKLRLGTAFDFSYEVGALISADQLEKVQAHVTDAVERGATLLAGGKHRPDIAPYAFEPTLLTDVTEDMMLCRGETFGPVVAIYRVSNDEEAIALANDTRYGLNASVWGSKARAEKVAARIQAGSVNVNEGFTASWASTDAPMGGFKESGVGRRHGREGIQKYTDVQTIATQSGMNVAPPRGMSAEAFATAMTAGLRLMKYLPLRK